jgi:fatty-acyl-CoA synthase
MAISRSRTGLRTSSFPGARIYHISSVEIENALYKHPAVGEAAIVAMPDDRWGETPCAFVELRPGHEASEAELLDFCLRHIARFKKPSRVVFGPLPKTTTGKIKKYELRKRAVRPTG